MNFDLAAIITAAGTAIGVVIGALFKRNQNKKDLLEHTENLVKISSNNDEILKELKLVGEKMYEISESQRRNDIVLLRQAFLTIYFQYNKTKEIPEVQFEALCSIYDVYTSLNGNGFIKEKFEEVHEWTRI